MNARMPAEVFPPGEFLREELEAREWSQQELADILDRPARLVSELISGKRAITLTGAAQDLVIGLMDQFLYRLQKRFKELQSTPLKGLKIRIFW